MGSDWKMFFSPSFCIIGFHWKFSAPAQGNKKKVLHNFSKLNLHAEFVGGGILYIVKSKFKPERSDGNFQMNREVLFVPLHAQQSTYTNALNRVYSTIAINANQHKFKRLDFWIE